MQVTKTMIFFVICVPNVDVYSERTFMFYCTPHDIIVDNIYELSTNSNNREKNGLV